MSKCQICGKDTNGPIWMKKCTPCAEDRNRIIDNAIAAERRRILKELKPKLGGDSLIWNIIERILKAGEGDI